MKKTKEIKSISELRRGMIIRHKRNGSQSYIIDDNLGHFVIAIRTMCIYNPNEWLICGTDAEEECVR